MDFGDKDIEQVDVNEMNEIDADGIDSRDWEVSVYIRKASFSLPEDLDIGQAMESMVPVTTAGTYERRIIMR